MTEIKRDLELKDVLLQIGGECAALPVLDDRTPEEMIGYDADGLPE